MRSCKEGDSQCQEDQRRLSFCEDIDVPDNGFTHQLCRDREFSTFASRRFYGQKNLEKFLWDPNRLATKAGICVSCKLQKEMEFNRLTKMMISDILVSRKK